MSRRILVIVIVVLGIVPVASGLVAVVGGPAFAPNGEPLNSSLDSEYRFVNVFWLAAGILLWWSVRKPADRAMVTRVILSIAALGGLSRIISFATTGWPHPIYVAAGILELVILPFIIWWHARTFPTVNQEQERRVR